MISVPAIRSLYHLRNFKLGKIKIDRTFVEAMARDRKASTIVRALVGLGSDWVWKSPRREVESEEQRQLLITHGCDQAQGAYDGGALSAANALALMEHRNV